MGKHTINAVTSYLAGLRQHEMARSIQLSGAGAVAALEQKLKDFYHFEYALSVSSATAGLLAVALALNLKRRDFITTPYTYGGSLAAWLMLGNRPIFADIEPLTLTLDCESARRAITPKTKAILAVDIFGHPCDSAALRRLADECGIWYVADAAQSMGAYRDRKPASHLADVLIVSFTAGKPVFAGEGGAVLTNNRELYQKLVWFTQHPARQHRDLGISLENEFAFNARIHPLGAVWANAQFEDSLLKLTTYQSQCFQAIDALNAISLTEQIAFAQDRIVPSFFRLTAVWNDKAVKEALLTALSEYGISARIEDSPVSVVYRQSAFLAQFARRYRLPHRCYEAERQARGRFCLRLTNG